MLIWIKVFAVGLHHNEPMEKIERLRQHGLFDAKAPRYTSYPPANHFRNGVGQRYQAEWLEAVPAGSDVSIYIHIPFCRRLCWFCACRTQGTSTLRPVDTYIDILLTEISACRAHLPANIKMARLHLGGGTPTILSPETMKRLLDGVFDAFNPSDTFEFSVEIDPTDAADPLMQTLIDAGMTRASIGVQDFAPDVQKAIGRPQSLEQTLHVVRFLRDRGVQSLNFDLLYGLPKQSKPSFAATLDHVLQMRPDRLAIYGYAHVPWMSKRQVMINADDLPGPVMRYELAEMAQERFSAAGYRTIGIDHFALPSDSLSAAQEANQLRRNFQGYTDDQSPTLIGFGASSISRFAQGYVQNAPSTSAYQDRVQHGLCAGHKGYLMSPEDTVIAHIVEDLLCRFVYRTTALCEAHTDFGDLIHRTAVSLMSAFPECFFISDCGLELREDMRQLVRIIASHIDGFASPMSAHSAAI